MKTLIIKVYGIRLGLKGVYTGKEIEIDKHCLKI